MDFLDVFNEYKLQKEEVNAVKYFTIEELEKYKKSGNQEFTFYNWDSNSFNEQMKMLKKHR